MNETWATKASFGEKKTLGIFFFFFFNFKVEILSFMSFLLQCDLLLPAFSDLGPFGLVTAE